MHWAVLILCALQPPAEVPQRDLLPDAPAFTLPRLKQTDIERSRTKAAAAGLEMAGLHRDIRKAARRGTWRNRGDSGWFWSVKIVSPGASGLRLHAGRYDSSKGTLYVAESGRNTKGVWNTEWSQLIYGDSVTVIFEPADRVKSRTLPFTIDTLSHQFR